MNEPMCALTSPTTTKEVEKYKNPESNA